MACSICAVYTGTDIDYSNSSFYQHELQLLVYVECLIYYWLLCILSINFSLLILNSIWQYLYLLFNQLQLNYGEIPYILEAQFQFIVSIIEFEVHESWVEDDEDQVSFLLWLMIGLKLMGMHLIRKLPTMVLLGWKN